MNEEAIIRKLIADGDGNGEDKRIVQLFSLINNMASTSDKQATGKKILRILDNVELSIEKQLIQKDVMEMETKKYQELFVDIDEHIERSSQKIEKVKKSLEEAKLVRKNRQEYDVLAKMIEEHPSRADSMKKLAKLQQELDEHHEKQKSLEQRLSERRKNMYALAVMLHSLDDNMEDETVSGGEERSTRASSREPSK